MPYPPADSSSPANEREVFLPGIEPSLEWLIEPTGKRLFFESYWEKRPLVVKRGCLDYFSPLLSLDAVDRVITTLDRRYPDITLKNASREISASEYTVDGDSIDVAKVYQLFAEGATITLAFLHTVLPELASFCRSLESEFSSPFQANVYLTPAGAQGAKHHYDTHDVFVLQVTGSKKWTIYGTPLELPLPGQDFDSSVHERGDPTLEFELEAGDVAYIPRGIVHDARSTDDVSLHITIGMLRYTWTGLLLELVTHAGLNDPAFRKALPPGFARREFDRTQARETLRSLLRRVCEASNFDTVLDSVADEFISSCPPLLRGQMAQVMALDRLTADSIAGVRAGAVFRLRADEQSVSVDCYGRQIAFPSYVGDAVRFALGSSRFVVRDLPGLDEAGKLVVVRRLIREGLVMVL
ncbi:MAG: cupin domain-containing protein [Bryobacteraceae bacterium]